MTTGTHRDIPMDPSRRHVQRDIATTMGRVAGVARGAVAAIVALAIELARRRRSKRATTTTTTMEKTTEADELGAFVEAAEDLSERLTTTTTTCIIAVVIWYLYIL